VSSSGTRPHGSVLDESNELQRAWDIFGSIIFRYYGLGGKNSMVNIQRGLDVSAVQCSAVQFPASASPSIDEVLYCVPLWVPAAVLHWWYK